VISIAENSNKFQKTRLWKEKSVEDVVALGPMAQAALVFIKRRRFKMKNINFCMKGVNSR
jgi:hypothetical protein